MVIECSTCKTQNDDRSLYCLKCGQSLAATNHSAFKLHSPMLDMSENEEADYGDIGQSNGISPNGLYSPLLDRQNVNKTAQAKTGRSGQGLRSPLLGGEPQGGPHPFGAKDTSHRLHSPVLDGPLEMTREFQYEQEVIDLQEEDYNSLRSPLLAAKVPLPENAQSNVDLIQQRPKPSQLSEQNVNLSSGQVQGDFNWSGGVNTNSSGPQTLQSVLGTTGASLPKSSPAVSALPPLKKPKSSLLPGAEELSDKQLGTVDNKSSGLKQGLVVILVLLAIGFKIWYLQALGSGIFSSMPFLFDQIGQILIMLLLIILILTL